MCFTLTSLTWPRKGPEGEGLSGGRVNTEGPRLSLYYFTAPSLYDDCHHHYIYTHTNYSSGQSVCVHLGSFETVMSNTVCSVLHSSLPQGELVQDKHLIWLGPCFLVHHHGSSLLTPWISAVTDKGILLSKGMPKGFICLLSLIKMIQRCMEMKCHSSRRTLQRVVWFEIVK